MCMCRRGDLFSCHFGCEDAKLGKTKPADPSGKLACPLCKGNHRFWKCLKYKRLEPDKKFEYVKSRKICFNCFGTDHMSSKCESDGRCQECETKHHPSLHKYFTENSKLLSSKLSTSGGPKEEENVADPKTVGLLRASPKRVYLQIVQVRLHAENGKYFDTYAVLDTCSESTMMRNDVASRLGLKRKAAKVNIATVKDAAEQISTEVVTLRVSSRDGSYEAEVDNVYLCPAGRFNMPSRPQLADDENEAYTHLDGVPTEAVAAEDVSILIGADVPEAVLVKSWRRGNVGQPLAVETVFGWTLFGPSFAKASTVHCSLQMTSEGIDRYGYLASDPPYARKLTPGEVEATSHRTWYLPMHPVTNPNKPGKVRVVNDAAATCEGISLNTALITGPDLLNSLVGALLRLRTGRIAIAADIEAMFHQVRVSKADSESLRFLWKSDIHAEGPPDVYKMLVHVFGAKNSPTCANYAIKRTARDNWSSFDSLTIETALKAFYVDDLLKSVSTTDTAIKLSKELIALLKLGGMRLTKFLSNSREVLEALPESERSPSTVLNINIGDEQIQRALGVFWETSKDIFTFSLIIKEVKPTKRGILVITCSLFDPLGFLAPFVLKAKILLQELWRAGLDWDVEIEEDHKKYWRKWLAGAEKVSSIRLNRQYLVEGQFTEVQLHIFCDASELAYGSVAYLRFTLKDGRHVCALVMSKSRLAPIKTITLPRLELNAAVVGARLSRLLLHELDLPIQRVQYWTDSTLVLQYINNKTHRVKVFVANRVTDIREVSMPRSWVHISGKENPADILSRGVMDPEMLLTTNWFTSAAFLMKDEDKWPNTGDVADLDPNDPEIRQKSVLFALCIKDEPAGIDLKRFSNWLRLKRVVVWIRRFVNNCNSPSKERITSQTISSEELVEAEAHVVKEVQQEAFQEEIRTIKAGNSVSHSNKLSPLCPFVDETGTLRVGGRLKNVNIPYDSKHQPILPKNHQVTRIIIDWYHRRNGHVGPDHVLSLVREHYWIISGLTVTKSVLSRCFFCRVRRALRQFPAMADLPAARAAFGEPPFACCGVDVFGHVIIKQGRKQIKRWVVLFTCMTIRAVHLEVVESCGTDSFNALRRFVNRRGCPKAMYSDNGGNFKGASKELREFVRGLDREAITDFAATMQIEWHFNPPKAPHMGRVWERLVRSVKEVMTGLMKDRVLTDPQLYTFLTEAESIVNSRPLTHLSDNPSDMEALTPNHILLGMHRNWASIAGTTEQDITSRKQWRQVQALRALLWRRWTREYLPSLTKRPCWRKEQPNLTVGELVLLEDEDLKRGKWPLGRVEKVMPGPDAVVRVADIRTKTGVYTRPVSKVIRLEDSYDVPQGGEDVAVMPKDQST